MTTPLDALIAAFRAASDFDLRAETRPEALVWCDPVNDFALVLPSLRRRLPHLFTLGEHDPALRQGPAVWLRAAIGHALPDFTWPLDEPAILYLPGVTRETLRAAEDCPPHLQLLAWLAVGGASFAHPNGRDWTLRGYLATKPANGAWAWRCRRMRPHARRCAVPRQNWSRWTSPNLRVSGWTQHG